MEKELIKFINAWLYHNEKLKQINKYLYEHTELFENKYEQDYNFELYMFFAGKITTFTKNYNKLMEKLTDKQIEQIRITKLLER